MRFLKSFKKFDENAQVTGSGDVVAPTIGNLPGVGELNGTGDIGFTFKKKKGVKGNPSEVTDMRDLAPAKGVTKVEDIK